jgi:transcriptional regulator with XRE-family HTH domain
LNISSIIRDKRRELNITLKEIADYVGVSEATVQRWESGNIKNLRHGRITKLAEVLNVTPDFLMGWNTESKMVVVKIPARFQNAFNEEQVEILEVAKEAADLGLTAADFREILNTLKKLKNIEPKP